MGRWRQADAMSDTQVTGRGGRVGKAGQGATKVGQEQPPILPHVPDGSMTKTASLGHWLRPGAPTPGHSPHFVPTPASGDAVLLGGSHRRNISNRLEVGHRKRGARR